MPSSHPGYANVDSSEALGLVASGRVDVLDVRTPGEFEQLGHIPGAALLPVQLIASGTATLPNGPKPLLVVCEHGIRSVQAVRFLASAGFTHLLNLSGGMAAWEGPREHSPAAGNALVGPSSWLLENGDLLPRDGLLLDLACGHGRHALLLAASGFRVRAIDRDAEKIDRINQVAARLNLTLDTAVEDLECDGKDLGSDTFDAILGFRYLHRPLFPALIRALRPGGVLIYETFTIDQAKRGSPTNPDFLLQPGELLDLVTSLRIERHREGEFDGADTAAVAARRDA
ncbi:MAG: methyltransferase domain-containing protein [Verrucomicrobia bacterium]|nr:methyltransferase domain-containing protein [Verrucomicrobiota bacterium]